MNDNVITMNLSKSESNSVIRYGLNQALILVAFILLCCGIGIVAGKAIEMLMFMLAVYTMRIFAGGFHANSKILCLILSIVLVCLGFGLLDLLAKYPEYSAAMSILTILAILKWVPVQDWHKPLSERERIQYRKYALIIAIFWMVFHYVTLLTGWTQVSSGISAGFFVIFFTVTSGVIKNRNLGNSLSSLKY